jgi:hypothetical protein
MKNFIPPVVRIPVVPPVVVLFFRDIPNGKSHISMLYIRNNIVILVAGFLGLGGAVGFWEFATVVRAVLPTVM